MTDKNDSAVAGIGLTYFLELATEEQGRVRNRITCRITEDPDLIVAAQDGIGR
jgi:hypothetical protein